MIFKLTTMQGLKKSKNTNMQYTWKACWETSPSDDEFQTHWERTRIGFYTVLHEWYMEGGSDGRWPRGESRGHRALIESRQLIRTSTLSRAMILKTKNNSKVWKCSSTILHDSDLSQTALNIWTIYTVSTDHWILPNIRSQLIKPWKTPSSSIHERNVTKKLASKLWVVPFHFKKLSTVQVSWNCI